MGDELDIDEKKGFPDHCKWVEEGAMQFRCTKPNVPWDSKRRDHMGMPLKGLDLD